MEKLEKDDIVCRDEETEQLLRITGDIKADQDVIEAKEISIKELKIEQ